MILEFISLVIILLTCISIIIVSWKKQEKKHMYRKINEEFGNETEIL